MSIPWLIHDFMPFFLTPSAQSDLTAYIYSILKVICPSQMVSPLPAFILALLPDIDDVIVQLPLESEKI
jgi:hypothetical protein